MARLTKRIVFSNQNARPAAEKLPSRKLKPLPQLAAQRSKVRAIAKAAKEEDERKRAIPVAADYALNPTPKPVKKKKKAGSLAYLKRLKKATKKRLRR